MALLVTVALLNGALNIVNKMVNVVAKQSLGMANGTLINYLEGTLIAHPRRILPMPVITGAAG